MLYLSNLSYAAWTRYIILFMFRLHCQPKEFIKYYARHQSERGHEILT